MQDRDIGKFACHLIFKTLSPKLLGLPVAVAAVLGAPGDGLNSYKDEEIATIARWQGYDPSDLVESGEAVQIEPITMENALEFLSIEEDVKPRGYVTTEAERGNLYFTTRRVAGRAYGLNLVFDAFGEELIVDNQRGMLNLMRLQRKFEDSDRRLIAFSMITGGAGGYESLSQWNSEEAQVDVDLEKNVAKVSMWRVYAEGSYPTRTNLLTDEERSVIEEYYDQTDAPEHGKVYKVISEIDLSYVQGDEPVVEVSADYVGIKWDVWNR